ncbi:hypothetical protein SUGI_0243800 [Cryptomeria japonica]|nr:hypothetical protein SUGI_0243800 [Cryptomeria japonica]
MEIIPGLPKDLAVQCLVRVPYKFNRKLMAVSKSWNALLTSAHFFKERQRRGDYEEVAVFLPQTGKTKSDFSVIIYSHLGHCLESLPQIPREFKLEYTDYYQSMFVRSRQLLLVLGLLNTCTDMEGVLIFDFLSRKWRLGTDMTCSRCYFACDPSSSEGLVYIAGGFHRKTFSPYLEAFVYNVEENKWDFLPPMSFDPNPCAGACLDGYLERATLRYRAGMLTAA